MPIAIEQPACPESSESNYLKWEGSDVESISITFNGPDIRHLREMGRQQLLADYESVVDSVDGAESTIVGMEAGDRFIFVARLLRRLQISPEIL